MDKLSPHMSSETDLKAHIVSYPELYEDLAVDVLEERLEMYTYACYIECFIEKEQSCTCESEGDCPNKECNCETDCWVNINNCDCDGECTDNS